MFNRWFPIVVIAATMSALALVIYLDKKESGDEQPAVDGFLSGTVGDPDRASGPEVPVPLSPQEHERIGYVLSVLDTLENSRARLPFYGELIRTYTEAGHLDSAAHWAGQRARQTGMHEDLLLTAELHLAAMQQKKEESHIKEEAKKAKEMYISALKLKPEDPDVLADLAVVYMSLLQPEASFSRLEQALKTDPDHLRANFNMGVLLHQMGNISESIPFFDRSLSLSEDPEWEAVVQSYLDRHHNELFHQ
jgi:tetratricopeptide (TPR) repeat protein